LYSRKRIDFRTIEGVYMRNGSNKIKSKELKYLGGMIWKEK